MNWFERYGIPGTYFYIALLSGLYALYPCQVEKIDMRALATFAASFLPVGYIISIYGQWRYLHSRRGGLHYRAALESFKTLLPKVQSCVNAKEPDLEALSCLNAATDKKASLDTHKFIQEWIRKRMDVIAINKSIVNATKLVSLLIPMLGFSLWRWDWQPNWALMAVLAIILLLICWIVKKAVRILEQQIVNVIVGDWKASGFKILSFVSSDENTKSQLDLYQKACKDAEEKITTENYVRGYEEGYKKGIESKLEKEVKDGK